MIIERTRTSWPSVRPGALANSCGVHDSKHASKGSAAVVPETQSMPATDAHAPAAQAAPEQATHEDIIADEHAAQETSGVDALGDDEQSVFMNVADVRAMAPTAGATGTMQDAADMAPPPPAHSTESPATAAAPHTTTYYTAATSAAAEAFEEAQLATGYEDPGSEVAGAGSDGEAADDEWEDGDDDGYAAIAWFPFGRFGTVQAHASGAGLTQPTFVAGVYNGVGGGATPQPSAFGLSPAYWSSSEDGDMSDTDSD